jgi:predicted small lipoprotein YifL
MRRTYRIVSALALLIAIGACGTAGDTPLVPDVDASMDGGYATGGNRTDDGSEDGSEGTDDGSELGSMTVESDTTDRNGGYATGGN